MTVLHFITGNEGKFKEVAAGVEPIGYGLHQLRVEYPEVQADELEDVVFFALDYLKEEIGGDFILEDSGLFIRSLGGFPGVYSAYVHQTLGNKGILSLLSEHDEPGDRGAVFRSCFGLHTGSEGAKVVTGECRGSISMEERGAGGFGYDPIFIPEGHERTFAQMSTEEKNTISHRGRALRSLISVLSPL